MMGQPKSGKLSVLLTPDSRRSAWEHELSSCFHCCDFHCYGHTNWCGYPAHSTILPTLLGCPMPTAVVTSYRQRQRPHPVGSTPPPLSPTASLFCAIISTAWLTGLLCLLLSSSHWRLAKLIDLPLCQPKVKRNLISRGSSSSGNSCAGCEMKMPAKWRR